jgi:leader peptidase (prepilin peptidase)/N-methyltransferase
LGVPVTFWLIFLFALGASVGSFLNVVVYRMPRDLSIVRPGSHCPACKHALAWYDNLPIIAWFMLRGRCRYCQAPFSIRYPLVELFTALLFVMLFWAYFILKVREGMPSLNQGGYLIYGGHIFLLSALLGSSLIDAEHWIIPLQVVYTVVLIALALSMIWPYVMDASSEEPWRVIPYATPKTAALALGAALGMGISLLLVRFKVLKRSFAEVDEAEEQARKEVKEAADIQVNIRREMLREIWFLAPIIILTLAGWAILSRSDAGAQKWETLITEQKWLTGLLGSVFGYMIGAAVVWATRILGSLAFGREAMGLGDVHLMAAVGAVLGWVSPTIAFFVAPFIGLGWALARMLLHKEREIPYGPFLSVATLIVMIWHDPIVNYFLQAFTPQQLLP